jgi:hypothetical protein
MSSNYDFYLLDKFMNNNDIFYSIDWRQEVFRIASLPFFDVMVDAKNLSVIEMPKKSPFGFKEHLISLLSLFLGFIIATHLDDQRKRKYYKEYRSSWINLDNKLISQNFDKDVFLKVPLSELKGNIYFGKNKFTLTYGGKKITLLREKASLKLQKALDEEFGRFKRYVENYV